MRRFMRRWAVLMLACAGSGVLLANSCAANLQRELEILWGSEASLDQVHNSWLIDAFGPGILKFW